jgi:glycosyltransferase involved in cell wall biosynthesis
MDFTVLIPVYNTIPAHLLEAFYSIYNTDYKRPYPVILVDDGSDRTETLRALEFIEKFPMVTVLHLDKNMGTPVALNEGHKLIETEYTAIMGSDDISHAERFVVQEAYLNAHPEIDVLGAGIFYFKSQDPYRQALIPPIIHHEKPKPGRFKGNPYWVCNHGTVIYKNQAVKAVGGYDTSFRRGQDVNLWERMLKAGFQFRNVQKVLYHHRRY